MLNVIWWKPRRYFWFHNLWMKIRMEYVCKKTISTQIELAECGSEIRMQLETERISKYAIVEPKISSQLSPDSFFHKQTKQLSNWNLFSTFCSAPRKFSSRVAFLLVLPVRQQRFPPQWASDTMSQDKWDWRKPHPNARLLAGRSKSPYLLHY